MEKKSDTKEKTKRGKSEVIEPGKEIKEEEKQGTKDISQLSDKAEEKHPPVPTDQGVGETLPTLAMDNIIEAEPYMGTDSTAVSKVTAIFTEEEKADPRVEEVKAWLEHLASGAVDVTREIDVGIAIAKTVSADYNEFYNYAQMSLAGRTILTGKVLLPLKELTKKAGYLWQRWADTHLPFLKPRSRERAMLLASRPDCHPFLVLGPNRLESLCQATKDVGALLKRYNILFTQDSETSPAEFKALVDAALNNEKLRQNQIEVSFDLVKQLTYFKVEVDQHLFSRLDEVEVTGGSKVKYLERLALNAGKVLAPPDAEQRLKDFNSLSARLVKTLAFIREDESQLAKIDKDTLLELWQEIQALKSKLVPNGQAEKTV